MNKNDDAGYLTRDEICKELSLSEPMIFKLLRKIQDQGLMEIKTIKKGRTVLYARSTVEELKNLRASGTFGIPRKITGTSGSHKKHGLNRQETPVLTLPPIPLPNLQSKEIIMKRFGNEAAIVAFMKTKLDEILAPKLAKLAEFEARVDQERLRLLTED